MRMNRLVVWAEASESHRETFVLLRVIGFIISDCLDSKSEESREARRGCRTFALLFSTQHCRRAANRVFSITSEWLGECVTGGMPEQYGVAKSDDGRLNIISSTGSRGNQLNQK